MHNKLIIKKNIADLVQSIALENTIIFCGAGISRNSGLPVVNQLVPYILKKMEMPEKDIKLIIDKFNNPIIPFESFIQNISLCCEIDEILNIYNQGVPNTNHLFLANLIKYGNIKTIITTNFDNLIETALEAAPNSMKKGKDYDVIYREEDFEKINWAEKRRRLIKIHGSVEDKESMVITIKQVASRKLSSQQEKIIKNVFSEGKHLNVLILGYSSSDVFDLSIHIQDIKENYKKVYYVQHETKKTRIESIEHVTDKNPFIKFIGSQRIYYDTDQLVKSLWESAISKYQPYIEVKSQINWMTNVDTWYTQVLRDETESIKFTIPARIFLQISEYKHAIEYYKNAVKIDKKVGHFKGVAAWVGNIGNVYLCIGEYEQAVKYFKKAINSSRKLGVKKEEGKWAGGIGNIYLYWKKYDEAIKYYKKAIKIAKKINNKEGEGTWLGNLGIVYKNIDDYDTALKCYYQAIDIAKDIGDKKREGSCLDNIGNIYRRTGRYDLAIKNHLQALTIYKNFSEKLSMGICIGNIGSDYYSYGNIRKAISNYEEAISVLLPILGKDHSEVKNIKENLLNARQSIPN